ncbi:MAG: cobalt ECF transporter T component CbiQ [Thermodesulfobacterium geofontis]|uniref:Cobalt ECF transporter T component CbiQ n=1 Tax=Thermodesulfobacterium geofontis TaxID=1295609 RepID=A0A2N7PPC1_9BACT|nr:MAG: cobalt ECF transporter T component CbiQ [Thermodesulfobacterium geofontis]
MHLEIFAEGNSFLHKLDPRIKILVFLFFAVLCAISKGILIPFFYLLFSFLLILIANLNFKILLNRLTGANFFILFIWIFIPLRYKGNPYIDLGFLKVSYEGIKYALSITLKCNAIILATIALLSTSTIFSLAHAMLYLKVPSKLVTIFFLFYRYISVMHEEYIKIKRAVLARGFNPKTNLHTYKTYAYMVGALLIKSFERSEEIYKAMLARGFKGFFPLLEHFKLKKIDLAFGIIGSSIIILIYILGI